MAYINGSETLFSAELHEGVDVEIVQETGESTTAVMSQKASTEAFLPKIPNSTGEEEVPLILKDSSVVRRAVSMNALPYRLVMRDDFSNAKFGTPQHEQHAVPLGFADERYVTKITTSTGSDRVYVIKGDGTQTTMNIDLDSHDAYSIVQRTLTGEIVCSTPSQGNRAANKEYVDAVYRHDITFEGGLDYNGTTGYVACSVYSRSNTEWDYSGLDCNLTGRATATGIITIDGTTYTVVGLEKGEGGVSYFIYYVKSDGTVEKFNFYDGEGTFTDTVTQMI